MSLLILSPTRETDSWVAAIQEEDPSIPVFVYPETLNLSEIDFVLTWNHPYGVFGKFPNLKCISSMGAGVDYLLKDPDLPLNVPITRIVDPELSKTMFEFILSLLLNQMRGLSHFKQLQLRNQWEPKMYKRIEDVRIGIMGVGEIGNYVVNRLMNLGFSVHGWAQSKKNNCKAEVFVGNNELKKFMQKSDFLVCLLPSTPSTRALLNKETLLMLPKGATLINVARGDILLENDLVEMLDSGHIESVSLDVFLEEPLPISHPFWTHKKIHITPHIASLTNPKTVAPQIVANYWRMKKGDSLLNEVSKEKGY
jgi:glyoxylate/hydroxypyruvate reductase A